MINELKGNLPHKTKTFEASGVTVSLSQHHKKTKNVGQPHTLITVAWLKNLPKLQHTSNVYDWENFEHKVESGREQRLHLLPPSETRWMERSRTYPGIANAMAEQWGKLL